MSSMYTVVCSNRTALLWPKALEKAKQKYSGVWLGRVHVITYEYSEENDSDKNTSKEAKIFSVKAQLCELKPYFTCFLTHHEECDKSFVRNVSKLTRDLDSSHLYSDTVWGILTGFCEADILSSLDCEPLTVTRVLGNCPIPLEKFTAGVWFSEMEKGVCHRKRSHQKVIKRESCPDDVTETIVQEINTERIIVDGCSSDDGIDMIITSGHTTESNWNITYTFEGGSFCCSSGILSGITTSGEYLKVDTTKTPKILCASGNCLMGHIDSEDCMALGWMHSGSIRQMVGYIVPTWFGYGGWGVNKYLINNPGLMTFAKSFFANQQTLMHELQDKFKQHLDTTFADHRKIYDECFNTSDSGMDGLPRECSGLVYDRDNVVFYGDPAWAAALKRNPDLDEYRFTLEELPANSDSSLSITNSSTLWRLTVRVLKPGHWDCPVPDDKSTRPGRPPLFIFSERVKFPKLLEGNAILTDLFVLFPLTGACETGDEHTVVFSMS